MRSGGEAAAGLGDGLPMISQLLQHILRSLCSQQNSPHFWVYSIFWRILPRNYPPPKWDDDAGPFDRAKGNKRNWILVWEDGYCDFAACSKEWKEAMEEPDEETDAEGQHKYNGGGPLQPELFFKMSHDIYNYGEGLMGKIAAERSHKWIFRDPPAHENVNLLPSSWQAPADSYPRTWEAQFKAGIQTIAVIAVGEGLLQLGSTKKILQDVDFVLMLQRKFNYLHSIPGLFAQTRANMSVTGMQMEAELQAAGHNVKSQHFSGLKRIVEQTDGLEANSSLPLNLNPSPLPSVTAQSFPTQTLPVDVPFMYNSLQALLSKLPAVTPAGPANADDVLSSPPVVPAAVHGMLWPPTLRGRVSSTHSTSPMNTQPIMPSSSPSSSSSTTAGLPIHSTDDFESYHCLFGPTLS